MAKEARSGAVFSSVQFSSIQSNSIQFSFFFLFFFLFFFIFFLLISTKRKEIIKNEEIIKHVEIIKLEDLHETLKCRHTAARPASEHTFFATKRA
jgi:Mn2+/Fe2+ NRAMP family transporter